MADNLQFPLEQWFYEMPICTRYWTTFTLLSSILVQCHILTPFQLFYSYRTVFYKSQYWRLLTNFFYFGPLSLDLVFHLFFLQRYSRLLEESSGRSPARFSWLLGFASVCLLVMAPWFSMAFLGNALSSTLVYIWSRKNPDVMLNFFGVLVFSAPYLPLVLMAFSVVVHGQVPKDELCGTVVGHLWYFFNDVYPPMHNGQKPLDPPRWWVRMFEGRPAEETAVAEEPVAATPAEQI